MATVDLSKKTVIELRRLAKLYGITLGAGLTKSGIIDKLQDALGDSLTEEDLTVLTVEERAAQAEETPQPAEALPETPSDDAPAPSPAPAPAAPVAPAAPAAPAQSAQPQFRAAWHNPGPRYTARPSYQAGSTYYAPRAPRQQDAPRVAPTRPTGYTPRFGPAPSQEQPRQEYPRYYEPARTGYNEPAQDRRPAYGQDAPRYDAPAQDRRPAYSQDASRYDAPAQAVTYNGFEANYAANRGPYPRAPQAPRTYAAPPAVRTEYYPPQELGGPNPAVGELLAAGDCSDGGGVLELHPDGYGFLRSDTLQPSSRDIYISMAQIRRFCLRSGDRVNGKVRPQRDGDRYTAMLYITDVNGVNPDHMCNRPTFDELTPIYPTRRINLETRGDSRLDDMRLVDLIAPLGFGQRALVLCPPDTGKRELMRDFANVISVNHPTATVLVLLIDETPEDATLFREQVKCGVLASTFDQPPETHLRLTDLVLEHAERLVEQGQDVVLLVDSLTRLAKIYTTAATQQGRNIPGMVNPASLMRAKKLFGAARCLKEGGSLTVIGAMNIETGSKVDDAVVEEFKGTANMELLLDTSVARAGIIPALNLQHSATRRVEALLDAKQTEGLRFIRETMGSTPSATAIPQLIALMDKAPSNEELLVKIKDWAAMLEQAK